jgi:hypothetical protein
MKTIIAGSRDILDYGAVVSAINESGYTITEVVSGGARGVDKMGERWADEHKIPVRQFLPKFEEENLRTRWTAPLARNVEMAEYAEALVLIWDGKSKGSQHMFKQASAKGLKIHVKRTTTS